MEKARHELVICIIGHTERALKGAGIKPQMASLIATGLADEIIALFGGQNITFPKEYARKQANKEASIYAEFKAGVCYRDLAVTHDMTERGLRKLLTRVKGRIEKSSAVCLSTEESTII